MAHAPIHFWENGGSGPAWVDDFALVPNVVGNPGFETGALSPWVASGNGAAVADGNALSGSYALKASGAYNGAEQVVTGLSPNTTYTLSGWVKVTNAGDYGYIGVKNYGGSERDQLNVATSYARVALTFTTGSSNTSTTIYLWQATGSGNAYADDFTLGQAAR